MPEEVKREREITDELAPEQEAKEGPGRAGR